MSSVESKHPNLFLGIGNILMYDDGVGVHTAHALMREPLPTGVEVLDGGCAGLALSHLIEDRNLILVADAIDIGLPPGTVRLTNGNELQPSRRSGMSVHDFHFFDALNETMAIGRAPKRIIMLGVQIEKIAFEIGLSPAVEAGMHELLGRAQRLLGFAKPNVTTLLKNDLRTTASPERQARHGY